MSTSRKRRVASSVGRPSPAEVPDPKDTLLSIVNGIASTFDFFEAVERGDGLVDAAKKAVKKASRRRKVFEQLEKQPRQGDKKNDEQDDEQDDDVVDVAWEASPDANDEDRR